MVVNQANILYISFIHMLLNKIFRSNIRPQFFIFICIVYAEKILETLDVSNLKYELIYGLKSLRYWYPANLRINSSPGTLLGFESNQSWTFLWFLGKYIFLLVVVIDSPLWWVPLLLWLVHFIFWVRL